MNLRRDALRRALSAATEIGNGGPERLMAIIPSTSYSKHCRRQKPNNGKACQYLTL
jgi:hypothetical protein